jgi:hypothetical protein
VILPFSKTSEEHTEEYWTEHFDSFLKPLIEESGELKAVRSEALRGDILKQIITSLVVSPVVVADLTDSNPNVYWELGVRQSFKQCTITVAEGGTKLPFDLSVKGTLFYYPANYIKNEKFRKQFKRAVHDCLSHPEIPDSPVLETISGRGTLFEIFRREETARRIDALIAENRYNSEVMKKVYDTIDKKKKTITSYRFRESCVELLITQRYLDESQEFYELCERCHSWLVSANEVLGEWMSVETSKSSELWFAAAREGFSRSSETYSQALENAKKKIEVIC